MYPFKRVHYNLIQNFKHFCTNHTNPNKLLKVGQTVSVFRQITKDDIERFSQISGDTNPIHFENDSQRAVVHGAFLNGLVSAVIGTRLPGPGVLVVSQNLNFPHKCFAGESLKITVKVSDVRKIIKVDFVCEVVEENKVVLYGDAKLIFNK